MEAIQVNSPNISERTMREMSQFFMRTSIPRILELIEKGELVFDKNSKRIYEEKVTKK